MLSRAGMLGCLFFIPLLTGGPGALGTYPEVVPTIEKLVVGSPRA